MLRRRASTCLAPRVLSVLLAVAVPLSAAADEGATPEPASVDGPDAPNQVEPTLSYRAFVDTYARIDYSFPKPQRVAHPTHPPDSSNGFSIGWVGLDLNFDSEYAGGALWLRFGPNATIFGVADAPLENGPTLDNVLQAYASFKPFDNLQIDLGKFLSPYGYEGLDTQDNPNYSLGLVNFVATPNHHTGLKVAFKATEDLSVTALVLNGWDSSFDANAGKTFGLVIDYTLGDVQLSASYGGGPQQPDMVPDLTTGELVEDEDANGRWRHLAGLIAQLNAGDLWLMVEGVFGTETIPGAGGDDESVSWWGATLLGRYTLSDRFALALRLDTVGDSDGWGTGVADGVQIFSETATFDMRFDKALLLRFETRIDHAGEAIFPQGVGDMEKLAVTSTLSAVIGFEGSLR